MALEFSAPWVPSGYGTQTKLWVRKLTEMGHEVAISSFFGQQGSPGEWEGHMVYPAGMHPYGADVIGMHATHFGADWIIALMDQWALPGDWLGSNRLAVWMPVDSDPLGDYDREKLDGSGRRPIAMSRFGQEKLAEAGYTDAMYVPHGIDTELFRPPNDRKGLREAMGLDDRFVIFMNAANMDKARKAYPEQLAAFARFSAKHDDAILLIHTIRSRPQGLDLMKLTARLGITEKVRWSAQYLMLAGMIDDETLRGSYGAADLFTSCSLGEGFGLTILEAQSCGVPVVVTDCSSMTEVGAPGWKVDGQGTWAEGHNAWWKRPYIDAITRVYEKAYQRGGTYVAKQKAARPHALEYDIHKVAEREMRPVLERLEGELS